MQLVLAEPNGLYLVTSSTLQRRRLTSGGLAPSWSPDGRRIAFIQLNADGTAGIYLLELADGRIRRLNDQPSARSLHDALTWAPDSRRLMYADTVIKLYDIETNQIQRIPCAHQDTDDLSFPVMSADGQYVAAGCINWYYPHPYIYTFIAPVIAPNEGEIVLTGSGELHWSPNTRPQRPARTPA